MTISERIFEILSERKMTLTELSDRTGIAQITISDWKTKKTNPAVYNNMTLCEIFEITPYELLTGKMDKEEARFLADCRDFSPEQRRRLIKYMKTLQSETEREYKNDGSREKRGCMDVLHSMTQDYTIQLEV